MGTNYFWFKKKMRENEFCENGLHIGKDSWGWVFQFEAHRELNLLSVEDYKNFLKKGYIYDEYDEEVTYEDFWRIVEETKKPMPSGRDKNILSDPQEKPSPLALLIPMWENEGLTFTEAEFR